MNINKRTLKRMDNLKEVCDFDQDTGIATVYVHYDCAGDIISGTLGNHDNPMLNHEALDYIEYILSIVPEEFSVKISLTVDDYQGYEPDTLIGAYENSLELKENTEKHHQKKKKGLMIAFIFIGMIFLILAVIAQKNDWFGYGGRGFSIIMVMLIEMLFEVYFEESFIFFTVSRGYRNLTKHEENRFKGITINAR